jgi:cysteine desulfurase / selenocysteine lyase
MTEDRLINPDDFPARDKSCYLNAASASLMYAKGADLIISWQKELAENGTINFDEKAEENIFENLRNSVSKLFASKPSDIAGGSSATELMSSLAWAILPFLKGNKIVSTTTAHPSTVYPWQRIARFAKMEFCMAKANEKGLIDTEEIINLIDERTAVVVISHVEYRTGQVYDLRRLAEESHKYGAYLVVDATQSAGQIPINVQETMVDAIVSSGYKWLCGPFGAAVMFLSPALQNKLDPGIVGWRSHKVMWEFKADRLEYVDTAKRFEASTMAYGCALGLAEGVKYLNSIGVERILKHNKNLANILSSNLKERGARILSPEKDAERSSIISIDFPGMDTEKIANKLNASNVIISYRMGAIRISPHLYNDESDIWVMINTIDKLLERL